LNINDLNGIFPSEIGKLTKLTLLDLDTNDLSGTIPSQIGLLLQLTALVLNDLHLNGNIPSEIGLLPLDNLNLANNLFTGEIPSQIANLPGITGHCNVWFGNNLTCDPSYPPGITRCMGIGGHYDYAGDAPICPPLPTTSSTSSSTSSIPSTTSSASSSSSSTSSSVVHSTSPVSFSVTWPTRFPNAKIVRVQYRLQGSNANWGAVTVDGTKLAATIPGLIPNKVYEYRLAVDNLVAPSPPVGPTLTFTTPSN